MLTRQHNIPHTPRTGDAAIYIIFYLKTQSHSAFISRINVSPFSAYLNLFPKQERWYPSRRQGAGLSARITRATSPRTVTGGCHSFHTTGWLVRAALTRRRIVSPPRTFKRPCSSNGSMEAWWSMSRSSVVW
jgi:hypothetical protein